jgi:hypothetical protein
MRDVKVADIPNSSVTTVAIEVIASPEAPNSSVTTVAIEVIASPEAPAAEAPIDTKPSKAKQKGGKSIPVKSSPLH